MIHCQCGEPLIDELDVGTLTVEGEEIPFRRRSDFIACSTCGELRSIRSLRAEAVAKGHLVVDEEDEERPDTALQQAADAAIAHILAVGGGGYGDADRDDHIDAVLSAFSDITSDEDD